MIGWSIITYQICTIVWNENVATNSITGPADPKDGSRFLYVWEISLLGVNFVDLSEYGIEACIFFKTRDFWFFYLFSILFSYYLFPIIYKCTKLPFSYFHLNSNKSADHLRDLSIFWISSLLIFSIYNDIIILKYWFEISSLFHVVFLRELF